MSRRFPETDPWQHPTHFWRHYFSEDVQDKADELRRTFLIDSQNQHMHIDVYSQESKAAPVVVFFHGGGGYARLFSGLAVALNKQGFHVVVPDMSGQGFSTGSRSDFLFSDFIENGLDAVTWARKEFSGPFILSGASLGSMLAYGVQAALIARGMQPAQATLTSNLFDPSSLDQMLGVTRFGFMAALGLEKFFAVSVELLSKLWPGVTIPYKPLAKFKDMVDDPSGEFYAHYKRDPNPIRRVSFRYMQSLIDYHYEVPLASNQHPVWVVNPMQDKMTDPELTQNCVQELGGPKSYIEWAGGHFSVEEGYNERFARLIRQCFDETSSLHTQETQTSTLKSVGRGCR